MTLRIGALRHGAVTRAKRRKAALWRRENSALFAKIQRDLDGWQFQRSAFMHGVVPLAPDEQPAGLRAIFGHLFGRAP